jgi:TolA-binding protein
VYADPKVAGLVNDNFIPVRVHVKDQAGEFKRLGERFNAQWTPTILLVDSNGDERHRVEGFLPADEFLPQLEIGAAHSAFAGRDFAGAERRFRAIVDGHAKSDVAAEALYWAGVARYKATGDASALSDTARAFSESYSQSTWAKKASVWAA